MKSVPFFMRFYGRTDEEILQCLEELKASGMPGFLRYRFTDAKQTCNIFVPPEHLPVRELNLYFATMQEAQTMHTNTVLQGIYHKWSTKDPQNTSFKLRKPKDAAFGL
jgi:hypothetical protein